MLITDIPKEIRDIVRKGTVIPATPLALDANRRFDAQHQTALIRYYIDAGVGGIAIGVHTTQFGIRNPEISLYEPVLTHVSQVIDEYAATRNRSLFKVAGVCGETDQASREARFSVSAGYHACLLSLAALQHASLEELLSHCRTIAGIMPVIGFYLQPAVGGRILPYEFWRQFVEIENVIAIKIAAFNRYQTFDVVRALCDADREKEIPLYTGNDDNILADLITEYRIQTDVGAKHVRFRGGLLGHWAVWTKTAVELLDKLQATVSNGENIPAELLTQGIEITDCNAAFFDSANNYVGCIPGLHEILRRQGLFPGTECLDHNEVLSVGQSQEIDRIYAAYPHLNDDDFVKAHLHEWLESLPG